MDILSSRRPDLLTKVKAGLAVGLFSVAFLTACGPATYQVGQEVKVNEGSRFTQPFSTNPLAQGCKTQDTEYLKIEEITSVPSVGAIARFDTLSCGDGWTPLEGNVSPELPTSTPTARPTADFWIHTSPTPTK